MGQQIGTTVVFSISNICLCLLVEKANKALTSVNSTPSSYVSEGSRPLSTMAWLRGPATISALQLPHGPAVSPLQCPLCPATWSVLQAAAQGPAACTSPLHFSPPPVNSPLHPPTPAFHPSSAISSLLHLSHSSFMWFTFNFSYVDFLRILVFFLQDFVQA